MIPRPFVLPPLRDVPQMLLLEGLNRTSDQIIKAAAVCREAKGTAVVGGRVLLALFSSRTYGGGLGPALVAEARIALEDHLNWSNRFNRDLFGTKPFSDDEGFQVAAGL